MTALLRKNTDLDATAEIIIPESLKKAAQQLKSEQQIVTKKIEEAKAEPIVRQNDESTKVFNLRQQQVVVKIKELEQRKVRAEKELAALLNQKNIKLHDDLKKATDILVNETKKIAPLEKQLETGMSKISNLKNEMQFFFESNLNERKNNSHYIEDQTREIRQLGELVQGTMNVLKKDLHEMILNVEKLSMEKIDIHSSIARLKEEVLAKESVIRTCELKREELFQIESRIAQHQKDLPHILETKSNHDSLLVEIEQLENKQTELKSEIQTAIQEKTEILAQHARLEFKLSQTGDLLSLRKDALSLIEKEILDAKKRLESIREEDFELRRTYQQDLVNLSKISSEIAQSEGLRSAAMLLQEESFDFYKIKKEVYSREIELLEVSHRDRVSQLDSEFKSKKLQWESEFKVFCEGKENDFKFHLESIDAEHLEDIKKKKSELLFHIADIVVKQSLNENFTSAAQKSDEAKKEVVAVFDKIFGVTNRWRAW
jgi:hypothetical protein